MIKITFMILLLWASNNYQIQESHIDCEAMLNKLISVSNQALILKSDIDSCVSIVKDLDNCNGLIDDSVYVGTVLIKNRITKPFANVCYKSGSEFGVNAFIDYANIHSGSAEEEISYSLERLFVGYPELVLNRVKKDKMLLDMIIWGFLNNRYYVDSSSIQVLNTDNYEEIFYRTNPFFLQNSNEYKYQIEYMLSGIKEQLEYLKTNEQR